MPKTKKKATARKTSSVKEIKKVESYEYLLVEYLKEMSNEITYLVLIVASLFMYVLLDLLQLSAQPDYEIIRSIFILMIIGGFGLFGLSSMTKRKIEKKFEAMFF